MSECVRDRRKGGGLSGKAGRKVMREGGEEREEGIKEQKTGKEKAMNYPRDHLCVCARPAINSSVIIFPPNT